jgi:hypothetical protein
MTPMGSYNINERSELVGSRLPTEPHPPNNFPKYRDKMRERRIKHGERSESCFGFELDSTPMGSCSDLNINGNRYMTTMGSYNINERSELVGSSLPAEPHPPNNFPKYRDKMRERRIKHGERSESYFKSQLQFPNKPIFTKKSCLFFETAFSMQKSNLIN